MKNKFSSRLLFALLLGLSFTFVGCDDDDPAPEDTPEAITEVKLTFTPTSGTAVVATATDADGDGSGFVFSPTNTNGIELKKGVQYTLDITIANQLETPVEDVTEEIKEEADEHQFFFSGTALNNVFTQTTTAYADTENDYFADGCTGCENSTTVVGLKTTWNIDAASGKTGVLNIRLKHQPDGLKTGSVTSGEDDFNLDFTVKSVD